MPRPRECVFAATALFAIFTATQGRTRAPYKELERTRFGQQARGRREAQKGSQNRKVVHITHYHILDNIRYPTFCCLILKRVFAYPPCSSHSAQHSAEIIFAEFRFSGWNFGDEDCFGRSLRQIALSKLNGSGICAAHASRVSAAQHRLPFLPKIYPDCRIQRYRAANSLNAKRAQLTVSDGDG